MLRGNAPAKIDDKGRLKVPNAFRAVIHEEHGPEVFVTSLTGESVRIYPMPVWLEIERKLAQAPSTHPARLRFLDRVNFFGQLSELDPHEPFPLSALRAAVDPVRPVLVESRFLSGRNPGFADYILFGAFQWARAVSPVRLLEPDDALFGWRERMLDLHDGIARNANGYPV